MKILSLDLGTKTGFALCDSGTNNIVHSGTWVLETERGMRYARKIRMDRRLDPRIMALVNKLSALIDELPIEWIFFEDVRFASSQAQAHLWASFRGAVWTFAHLNGIQVDCLDTGKLKKFATGSGSADKPAMLSAWLKKHPEYNKKGLAVSPNSGILLGDDAIDALHLLDFALSVLKA